MPLIFGLRNALHLEPPSAFQREYVKTSEEARSHITEMEYQMIKNKLTNTLAGEKASNSSDEDKDLGDQKTIDVQSARKTSIARKQMAIKDKPQFKRKKAKVIIHYGAVIFACVVCTHTHTHSSFNCWLANIVS